MEPIKASTLWNETYRVLRHEILSMRPGENRLPSEEELSHSLGVSRATIREAMQALVKQGYVTRRHGKGNFGHPSTAALHHRMDQTMNFLSLFGTDTQPVMCVPLSSGTRAASPAMTHRYPAPCEEVFAQTWLYTLEGAPLVLCRVETPSDLLPPSPPLPEQCKLDVWLAALCGRDVAYYAAHLGCRADPAAACALSLPQDSVLLNCQEVVYDIQDYPVSFCDLYFHPDYTDLSMVLRI